MTLLLDERQRCCHLLLWPPTLHLRDEQPVNPKENASMDQFQITKENKKCTLSKQFNFGHQSINNLLSFFLILSGQSRLKCSTEPQNLQPPPAEGSVTGQLMWAALCKHSVPGGLPTLTIWIQSSWIVRTALGQMAFLFADKACREWELRCVGQGEGAVVKLIRSQLQLQKQVAGDLGELTFHLFQGKLSFGRPSMCAQ